MGDRRRQGLLKEAQVASLYGEQSFRDIIFQSQNMPLPTPLGFGCGYAKAGDWLPARRELEHYVGKPAPLQRLLSGPFAWYSSLRDLKAALSEQRRKLAPYLYLADPGFMMGGFSSLSALITEATTNRKQAYDNWFLKNSNTTAAGAAYWMWLFSGYPSAAIAPSADVNSTAPTSQFKIPTVPAGHSQHLLFATAMSTVAAGALLIADMTLVVQPVLATATAQTIGGSPIRYGNNGQNGVLPFCFQGSATDSALAPNLTITYTESTAGTTGHTTGAQTGVASTPAFRTGLSTGQLFFPLQAGDVGVQRIETTTWSVSRLAAMFFGMAYPYCFVPLGVANVMFGTDLLASQFNMVQVQTNAAITFFLMAATTSSGIIQGELTLIAGNS